MNKKYFIPVALIAGAASMIGLQAFAQSTTSTPATAVAQTQTITNNQKTDTKDTDQEVNDDTGTVQASDTDQETNDDSGSSHVQVKSGSHTQTDDHSDGETNDD